VQFHPQVCSAPLPRRFIAHAVTATDTSTNKPAMAVFSTRVVLTAMVLIATAGISPALTTGFKAGCSVINSAIGGLIL
jgi:hypothetical protein